ncbi:site-specific integrase [Halobacillus sp. GSS1]|uniref:Site-specific integrase n=1 Tax=Halobacillus trueperi TaxID=156205 RepID=A0A3D8VE41_9BACI|nr:MULTISPECIES: site-specific integrase [Halobacillus]MBN9654671.1 site-specific integrase [Halobacillus sp. GSS1]MEC3884499.1 site-specific integrase [Halobacillus sp. HZG1]RDY67620.1 site-specific integrase [Halobacillus trueperi]
MANYRKRGNKWYFQIYTGVDPSTGKKKFTSKGGFKTKKEAQMAAAEVEKEVFENTYVKEQNITFQEFTLEWLKTYRDTAKISSVRNRQHNLDHLNRFFGNKKIKDITRKQYQAMLASLHNAGYAFNTLDGIHATGRMVFRKAVEFNIIKDSPCDFAKIPRKVETVEEVESSKGEIKFMEKEELIRFLNAAKESGIDKDYPMFLTLAYSGLRVGELIALKWSDIDMYKKTLRVTKTYYNPNNRTKEYQLLTPKTKGSIRTLKMDAGVIEVLKRHKEHQDDLIEKMKNEYTQLDFVFAKEVQNLGYPEFLKTVNTHMRRLLKISGIHKELTPHSLRHTHTSLLIEAGVGVKEIQQRLGHGDINTTMNIYAHITENMEEKASQKFSELMRGSLDL